MLHIQNVISFLPGTSISYKSVGGIANDLLNSIPAEQETGTYTRFGRELIFQLVDPSMSRLGEANEIDFSEYQEGYLAKPYALKTALPLDLEQLTPTQVNRIQQAITGLTGTLDRWYEKQASNLVGTFTGTAVTKAWTDDTSDPIQDAKKLRQTLAMPANVAVLGKKVFDRLCYHPKVMALRATTRAGSVTKEELAEMLEVKDIYIPEMKVDTNVRGRATASDYIWGNVFFMGYRNPSPEIGPEEITFAAKIRLEVPTGIQGAPRESVVYSASERGTLVRAWENPNRGFAGASMIQVGRKYDLKQIAPDLGANLTGVLG